MRPARLLHTPYSSLVQWPVDSLTRFNPGGYPDTPLYNIQAVAGATGVPAITLRSWERRYGVPQPARDEKGYRLYSRRDVAIVDWLRERVRQGIGISQAVNLLHMLDAGDAVEQTPVLNFEQLQDELMAAIVALDEPSVNRAIAGALTVAPVEDVALGLIQPVLYDIGARWQVGTLSVTREHVGSNILRSHLTQLIRLSPAPIRDARIMIGCAPGERHDIGALTLALFLRRRGYDVLFAGASVEPESFITDTARIRPNAVCLSASLISSAESLIGLCSKLQTLDGDTFLGFGGHAYQQHPEFINRTPGRYLGDDARTATRCIEEILERGLN